MPLGLPLGACERKEKKKNRNNQNAGPRVFAVKCGRHIACLQEWCEVVAVSVTRMQPLYCEFAAASLRVRGCLIASSWLLDYKFVTASEPRESHAATLL